MYFLPADPKYDESGESVSKRGGEKADTLADSVKEEVAKNMTSYVSLPHKYTLSSPN